MRCVEPAVLSAAPVSAAAHACQSCSAAGRAGGGGQAAGGQQQGRGEGGISRKAYRGVGQSGLLVGCESDKMYSILMNIATLVVATVPTCNLHSSLREWVGRRPGRKALWNPLCTKAEIEVVLWPSCPLRFLGQFGKV
jgi:hypothetical protein